MILLFRKLTNIFLDGTIDICNEVGNKCFSDNVRRFLSRKEEEKDIEECDCKADCEMVHFFTSMMQIPFKTKQGEKDELLNTKDKSGTLYNYLTDPNNEFQVNCLKRSTRFNLSKLSKKEQTYSRMLSLKT